MEERADLQTTVQDLRRIVREVEQRVSRLEGLVLLPAAVSAGVAGPEEEAAHHQPAKDPRPARVDVLELEIGEHWLGPVGVAVLLVGITFFINYPLGPVFPHSAQLVLSYLVAAGLFAASRWWGERYPFTAHILCAGSLVLLYLSTLRLHFFTAAPLVSSAAIGAALLALVPGLCFYAAVRLGREHLAGLALVLGLATALCVDAGQLSLALTAATAVAMVELGLWRGWRRGIAAALLLTYATHLLLILGNPLVGNPLQATPEHHYNLVYLFTYWALFSAVGLFRHPEEAGDSELAGFLFSLVNNAGFLLLAVLAGLFHFKAHFALVQLVVAVCCLGLASAYWMRRQNGLATAVYACFGYLALSMAIIAYFPSPVRFVWLGWQSLLVVCTAIWFRSKLVVVANLFIYGGIFLVYLFAVPPHPAVSLSYALVALLSARVMNWQRQRLDLRTEAMRNIYLTSAFAIIPYGLYHTVPASYVSLSWVGAAAFYFALSLILKNMKYRWMAILTMLLTVVYVFGVDLGRLSPVFRIVSLLVLGLALLAVSVIYARYRQPDRSAGDSARGSNEP